MNIATLTSQLVFKRLTDVIESVLPGNTVGAKYIDENNRLKREVETTRDERDRARTQRNRAVAQQKETEERLNAHRAKARRLSRRIVPRMATHITRNVVSMPLEAVPFVGWGVIAGVTALEIKDACQTIKDMATLQASFGSKEDNGVVGSQYCGFTKDQLLHKIWKGDTGKSCEDLRETGLDLDECAPSRPLPPPADTVGTPERELPDPPAPPMPSPSPGPPVVENPSPPAKP